jgi:hypothetical protein
MATSNDLVFTNISTSGAAANPGTRGTSLEVAFAAAVLVAANG